MRDDSGASRMSPVHRRCREIYWEELDEPPPGVVLPGAVVVLPAVPPVVSLLPVPLVPLLPGVDGAVVPGAALVPPPAAPPLSGPPMLPPVAPGLSVLLPPVPELGGVLGVGVVGVLEVLGAEVLPEVLELPVVSGVPASFLPQAVSARAATRAASKTECFMSDPLKKTCWKISTLW